MTTKHEDHDSQREAAREPSAAPNANQGQNHEQDPLDDLSDIISLSADVHGQELRVDEAICRTEQGDTKVRRVGLPPTGAEHGVTYKDVSVSVEIAGQPKKKSG